MKNTFDRKKENKRKTERVFLCLVVSLLLGTVACGKEEIVFEESNTIYTESYFEEIQEIIYWNGDTRYVIESKEKRDFLSRYLLLS